MIEEKLFPYAFLLLIWQYYIAIAMNDIKKDIVLFTFSSWQSFKKKLLSENISLSNLDWVTTGFVDYIITCTLLLEFISAMSIILKDSEYSNILKEDMIALLKNKAAGRIISDNYAVSVDITIFAMNYLGLNKNIILDYIKWITVWLLDRYDEWKYNFGIPPLGATPEIEVKNLLWYAFNFYEPTKTTSLMVIGCILYWISILDPKNYKKYVNNFLSVGIWSATLYNERDTCIYHSINKYISFKRKNENTYLKQLINRTVYL